jgi:hypothetical protein
MINQLHFAETASSKELYYLEVIHLKPLLATYSPSQLCIYSQQFALSVPRYGANSRLGLIGATLARYFGQATTLHILEILLNSVQLAQNRLTALSINNQVVPPLLVYCII